MTPAEGGCVLGEYACQPAHPASIGRGKEASGLALHGTGLPDELAPFGLGKGGLRVDGRHERPNRSVIAMGCLGKLCFGASLPHGA